MKFIKFIIPTLAIVLLTACAPNLSSSNYNVNSVGAANKVVRGVIVSERYVQVGKNSGTGALAGGVAGAAAGSVIGGGTRANIIGGVGGAIVGGLLGNEIEKSVSRSTNIEYIIKTHKGGMLSVVQGPQPPLAVGQRVMVILGSPARVIADSY